jgi:hypothetical protein
MYNKGHIEVEKGKKIVVPIGAQGGRGEPTTSYIQDTFNVDFFT